MENEEDTAMDGIEPSKTVKTKRKSASEETRQITRGRLVDYHHADGDGVSELSALVTNVNRLGDMSTVCLTVFDVLGTTFGTVGVQEGTEPGQWSWPTLS